MRVLGVWLTATTPMSLPIRKLINRYLGSWNLHAVGFDESLSLKKSPGRQSLTKTVVFSNENCCFGKPSSQTVNPQRQRSASMVTGRRTHRNHWCPQHPCSVVSMVYLTAVDAFVIPATSPVSEAPAALFPRARRLVDLVRGKAPCGCLHLSGSRL